jgi:hypothetical protein
MVNTFYGPLLVRDRTRLFVLDSLEFSEITNGDQLLCVLLHTRKTLISIAKVQYSSNIKYIIIVHFGTSYCVTYICYKGERYKIEENI